MHSHCDPSCSIKEIYHERNKIEISNGAEFIYTSKYSMTKKSNKVIISYISQKYDEADRDTNLLGGHRPVSLVMNQNGNAFLHVIGMLLTHCLSPAQEAFRVPYLNKRITI
jgi:hypothetical protein